MLGLNRAEVKHVAQPGDYRVARALAHERAAGRALLQAQQAGVLERSQRLAQRVARYAELLGQRALGRQPIAGAQAPIGKFLANLIGDFLECAQVADAAELRPGRGAAARAGFLRLTFVARSCVPLVQPLIS